MSKPTYRSEAHRLAHQVCEYYWVYLHAEQLKLLDRIKENRKG